MRKNTKNTLALYLIRDIRRLGLNPRRFLPVIHAVTRTEPINEYVARQEVRMAVDEFISERIDSRGDLQWA